ncbi:MAG: hypothetical protein AAGF95_27970 [Chloroflexota bacterium]
MQVYFKAIRLVLCSMLLGSLVVTTAWFVPQAGAQETVPESNDDGTVRYVSPSEARESDIVQRARDTGRTVEQVRQIALFEDAFRAYRSVLRTRYDDRIAGSWIEYEPVPKGYVRFVQEVPSEAIAALETFKILDTNNVILLDDGTISLDNHFRRVELSAKALVDLGYTNAEISYNQVEDQLEIRLLLSEDTSAPVVEDLAVAIQQQVNKDRRVAGQDALQDTAATVDTNDLNLLVERGSGPMIVLESAYGRAGEVVEGAERCTSGWSVSGSKGDGILTAGHCDLVSEYWFPGGTPLDIEYVSSVFGSRGDVAYFETLQFPSEAKFYNGYQIRDVTQLQRTKDMRNEEVCFYGRSSNDQRCGYMVEDVGAFAIIEDANGNERTIGNLARVLNPHGITRGGDSGGPWFTYTTAWGTHVGTTENDVFSYFMPVEEAQRELNVTIKTR